MSKRMFFAAIAAVALVACEKNEVSENAANDQKVSLEVIIPSVETKSSGEGGNEENAITDYQIFIYDRTNRMLEAYASPDPSSNVVNLQCTTGPKEVVVLANAPDMSSYISYDKLLQARSKLADNSVGSLVMEGHASPTLTASVNTVTVDLVRIVSKIVLSGITLNFESAAYRELDFVIQEIYLTNVAADKTYMAATADPTEWYNQIRRTSTTPVDALVYDKVNDVNITESRRYNVPHHFYCYPNPYKEDTFSADKWEPRPTRLVIKAELGGVPYYYPISLPQLEQNTRYFVSLDIMRPGALGPEEDMDKYAVQLTLNVKGWNDAANVTETI